MRFPSFFFLYTEFKKIIRWGGEIRTLDTLRYTCFLYNPQGYKQHLYILQRPEGGRFELPIPCGILAFQASALGHYATLPASVEIYIPSLRNSISFCWLLFLKWGYATPPEGFTISHIEQKINRQHSFAVIAK